MSMAFLVYENESCDAPLQTVYTFCELSSLFILNWSSIVWLPT